MISCQATYLVHLRPRPGKGKTGLLPTVVLSKVLVTGVQIVGQFLSSGSVGTPSLHLLAFLAVASLAL